ncbi:MAG: head decoration protein [Desulfobacterales bacterium]|nr:head decoration protein [Desulfobacterales bacterium]
MSLDNTETYTPDTLVMAGFPEYAEPETIKSGETLTRGTVVGKITATGKIVKSLAAASDGSKDPIGILVEDVDASAADVIAPVYKAGVFNPDSLTLGTGHSEATVKAAFEGTPLFLRKLG